MKIFNFFPSQPEMKYKMIDYVERAPIFNSFLYKDVALFYQFKTHKEVTNSFSLIPDGSIDLLFCCSDKKPTAFLWTSPSKRSERLEFEKDCEYFGVRFYPEQSILYLEYSMKKLLDKTIPLSDVMTVDPYFIEQFYGKTFDERIQLFEDFVKKIPPALTHHDLIHHSVKQIYTNKGNISIKDLAFDIGYTDRYLRKKFVETIGFTPKQFSDMVRFQNTVVAMLSEKNKKKNLLDIAYDNGYYDQAHFIKSFKKFSDLTPGEFLHKLKLNS